MDRVTEAFEPSTMPVALKYIAYGKLSEVSNGPKFLPLPPGTVPIFLCEMQCAKTLLLGHAVPWPQGDRE